MANRRLLWHIRQLRRSVFTTHELCALSGKSLSAVTQSLIALEEQGLILKIYRGIWAEGLHEKLSPYTVIPLLLPRQRSYVSFISALHLYGIIEQIPQMITLASLIHTKTIHTKIGTFSIHKIHPRFFSGFNWYKKEGVFLIAEPEKALVDSLYLSTRRKKQFGHFPELHFPRTFSFGRAKKWVEKIPERRIRVSVQRKLDALIAQYKK